MGCEIAHYVTSTVFDGGDFPVRLPDKIRYSVASGRNLNGIGICICGL